MNINPRGLRPIQLMLIMACVLGLAPATGQAARKQPNVVLILMDDMGWRDVGFMGNSFVETPRLDKLAKNGLVFTQAYASAPNCAPTRACLMSGQYTPRHGIYTVVDPRQPPGSPWHKLLGADSKSELDTGIVTIAETMQSGGYATGFFGMWNLGRGRTGPVTPGGQGFQKVVFPENLGFAKDAYFSDSGEYLSDRLTDEVLKFMESNRDRPFFVYYPDHAVHAPYKPKPDLVKKYQAKAARSGDRRDDPDYAATIEAVDQNVGRILDRLEQLKLLDDTLVIFTSDNGGTPQYTAPLNGSKGQLYEGGIRVPLVVAGAGVAQAGRTSDVPVASVDLYPTLVDLAGLPAPPGQIQDGVSLMPLLGARGSLAPRRMYWHFPCYVGKSPPSSALRDGDFKLIEFFEDGGRIELYNLRTDPGEKNNLAGVMTEKTRTLTADLKSWQSSTGAMIPSTNNPAYNPQAERPRGGGGAAPAGRGPMGGNRGGPRGGPQKPRGMNE